MPPQGSGPRAGPGPRGALRRAALAAASMLLLEGFSALVLLVLRGDSYRDFAAVRERFAASSLGAHLGGDPNHPRDPAERATLRLDPHLGWVHAAGDGINNAGFRSDVDYPWPSPPGELVVGVFGGSVAESLCSRQRKPMAKRLQAIAAGRGYETVRVLCFAMVGHRQPQGLFAFERYVDTVDLAIFVEGFNEAVFWGEPGYPADFPNSALWRAFARAPSPRETALAGRLDALADARRRLSDAFDLPGAGRSAAAQLTWQVLAARLEGERQNLAAEAAAVAAAAAPGRDPLGFDEKRARDRYFTELDGILRDTAALGARRRVPVLQVLQPNQYVAGSKPFSAEERERFLGNTAIRRFVVSGWPRLQSTFASSGADGVAVVDLTGMFGDVTETVYADDCCHLNELGNRLMAERILAELASRPGVVEAIALPGARADRLRSGATPVPGGVASAASVASAAADSP